MTMITDICRAYFGRYVGAGRWSPPNRCDSCPLREPCMRKGATPARTLEELNEARAAFVAAAEAIIAGGAG